MNQYTAPMQEIDYQQIETFILDQFHFHDPVINPVPDIIVVLEN